MMAVCKPKNMKWQIVRGVIGFVLFALGIAAFIEDQYAVFFISVGASLFFFKGCPSCWVCETYQIASTSDKAEETLSKK